MKTNIYFEPPSRLQLLDKLKHFVSFSDFLLLVSGGRGAGKSTILSQLKPDPSDSTLCSCFLRPESEIGPQAVLQQLAVQLPSHEESVQDFAANLTAFHNQLKAMRAAGKKCLIFVDDAEYLSADALELLLNLHVAEAQLVLVSDHEYADGVLDNTHVKHMEGRVHHMTIEGMTVEESLDYLQMCHPAVASLPDKKKNELVQLAEGMPGRIETLLAGGKVAPSYSAKKATAFPLPPMHMAGIGVVLIAIVAVSLLQFMPEDTLQDNEPVAERLSVPLPVVTSEGNDAKEMVLPQQGAVESKPSQPEPSVTQQAKVDLANRLREQELKLKGQVQQQDGVVEQGSAQADIPPAEEPVQQAVETQKVEPSAQVSVENRSLEQDLRAIVAQNNGAAQELSPGGAPAEQVVQKEEIKAPPAQIKKADVKQVVKVPSSQSSMSAYEQRLLAMPAKSYTLQVLGARSQKSALDFIQKHGGGSQFYYFSTIYKGAPWHVVIYGNYPNRDIANASIRKMPAALQKSKPWARSLQGVQLDIRKKK